MSNLVTIKIKTQAGMLELTLEQARDLKRTLDQMFPTQLFDQTPVPFHTGPHRDHTGHPLPAVPSVTC